MPMALIPSVGCSERHTQEKHRCVALVDLINHIFDGLENRCRVVILGLRQSRRSRLQVTEDLYEDPSRPPYLGIITCSAVRDKYESEEK